VLNQELVGIVQHAEDPLAAIRDALVKVSDIMDGEM
jgi:hypothetical protein